MHGEVFKIYEMIRLSIMVKLNVGRYTKALSSYSRVHVFGDKFYQFIFKNQEKVLHTHILRYCAMVHFCYSSYCSGLIFIRCYVQIRWAQKICSALYYISHVEFPLKMDLVQSIKKNWQLSVFRRIWWAFQWWISLIHICWAKGMGLTLNSSFIEYQIWLYFPSSLTQYLLS